MLENFLEWAAGDRGEDNIGGQDEIGPRISNIVWDPVSPDAGETVNVSATVTDPTEVTLVNLKYNNGTHDVTVPMTNIGGDVYEAEITDVTSGSLDITIEAEDADSNVATRASYTITWIGTTTTTGTTTDTNTTTTDTGSGTGFPIDPMLLAIIGGAVVLVVIIVIVVKKR
jgi:hypothetical protein